MTLKFDIQPSPNVTSDKDRAAKLVDPGFGRVFTDHMAIVRYSQGTALDGFALTGMALGKPSGSCGRLRSSRRAPA